MKAEAFFKLVEIRTKSASVLPYLVGTLFAAVYFGQFQWVNALLMLAAMLCLDLAVTTLNHLREDDSEYSTFYLEGVKYSRAAVRRLILILLAAGAVAGMVLAWRTGPVVWFLGILSFLAGLAYSAGPLPLQRTPLGEIVSGFFMGFVILFLACHIHLGNESFDAYLFARRLTLEIDLADLGAIGLLSMPLVTAIANVMLANNICDMKADWNAGRFTLPVLLGRPRSLLWYNAGYLIGAAAILLAVVAQVLPLRGLLLIPVFLPVMRNARRFSGGPDKVRTFPLAVQNLNLIGLAMVAVLFSQLLI